MPVLTVIGGPNGSGKSTFTPKLMFEGRDNLLDPDAIARRMNPSDLRVASIDAAREVIRRTRAYLRDGESFAIETTLSSASILETMNQGRDRGFRVHLIRLRGKSGVEPGTCTRTRRPGRARCAGRRHSATV